MTLDLLDENIFNCALEAGFTICTKDHLKNLNISESIADPETLIKFASLILQNRPSKTYVWEVYDEYGILKKFDTEQAAINFVAGMEFQIRKVEIDWTPLL